MLYIIIYINVKYTITITITITIITITIMLNFELVTVVSYYKQSKFSSFRKERYMTIDLYRLIRDLKDI